MFTYISICLPIVNIEKKNDMEMHFEKYAQKWRLEDVLVTLVCLETFLQNAVTIKTCSAFSILVNEN